MGLFQKLVITLIIVILAAAAAFATGTPHTSYGVVDGAEASNSCSWTFYVVNRPDETRTDYLDNSGTIYFWRALVGNLETPWLIGDDSMVIVKKENNSATSNHTGFYAVMNEDLSNEYPQLYNTCTLREIPIPAAVIAGNVVNLTWSPAQTDVSETPHGNNIIGYNVYRSTDPATGFTKINNSLVTITNYSDSSGEAAATYYYAIEPVFRGDVALGTYSANSNSVEYPSFLSTILGVSPGSGQQGQTMTVNIISENTNWSGDMTSAVHFSGSGITVNSATATGLTQISANITIALNAVAGSREVTVDGAYGAASFTVIGAPKVLGIAPISGDQGATLDFNMSGEYTNWSGDMTSAIHFSGSGVTLNYAIATSTTQILGNITIDPNALPGNRTVTVDGALQSATFTVLAVPKLTAISPSSARQNQTLDIIIGGEYTSWSGDMASAVHFSGSGITVNSATGNGTTIAANITIAADAATTPRTLTVDGTTSSETFTVIAQNLDNDIVLDLDYDPATGNIFWVSIPYNNNFTNASDIIAKINSDHGLAADSGNIITQIGRFNSTIQQYETYDYLSTLGWSGTNFEVIVGESIFLNIAADVDATLPGSHDPTFAFNLTHNSSLGSIFWISLPRSGNFADAVSIIADINNDAGLPADSGDLVTQIGHWDGATQSYVTYDYLGILGWSGTNFDYVSAEGYFINLEGDINNWIPSTN